MALVLQTPAGSKKLFWAGCVVSALLALMLIMSAVMKLMKPDQLVEGFVKLGWDESLAVGLGVVELACAVLYAIPRTSILGAVLITGYMGGAIATHVRQHDFGSIVMPIILAVLAWLGLYWRDARLRALLPLRS